jgi:hypothetical protein
VRVRGQETRKFFKATLSRNLIVCFSSSLSPVMATATSTEMSMSVGTLSIYLFGLQVIKINKKCIKMINLQNLQRLATPLAPAPEE